MILSEQHKFKLYKTVVHIDTKKSFVVLFFTHKITLKSHHNTSEWLLEKVLKPLGAMRVAKSILHIQSNI